MKKDLTNSQLDRQNILIKEIKIFYILICRRMIIEENLRMH